MPEDNNILKCCGQPFAVQKMEKSRGAWVLSGNIDERVRFCPFCGAEMPKFVAYTSHTFFDYSLTNLGATLKEFLEDTGDK